VIHFAGVVGQVFPEANCVVLVSRLGLGLVLVRPLLLKVMQNSTVLNTCIV